RGGGTSLAGQCCNVAVVLDFSKYMAEILEVDPARRVARVQPGVILDHLRNAAEKHHLTFAPDPASHDRCTLGGMIGNNSCGVHSVMAGKTKENVEELEILTYDGLRMRVGPTSEEELKKIIAGGGRRGEIYRGLRDLRDRCGDLVRERYPRIPRRVSGYNLDERARALMKALKGSGAPSMKLYDDAIAEAHIWEVRESGLGATAYVPGKPDTWEGWEDSAVPPERMGDYLRELRKLYDAHGYDGSFYGHFGQGCLHTRINFDLTTAAGIANFRSFIEEAADLVVSFGGSLSGEHGDGQSRAELLPKMFGEDVVQAFREFKAIWDPDGRMNPNKLVDPYRIDENLRYGSDYHHPDPPTHFGFPE